MRPREVGGWEPDDDDQRELVELWHLSRVAISGKRPDGGRYASQRNDRIGWVVAEFCKIHANEPNVARKWIYVRAVENLGTTLEGCPISVAPKRKRH